MGLGEQARRALQAATAAPRLYAAAVSAGLGPRGAIEVLRVSEAALRAAATRAAGVPGRRNAVRHFLWQAVLTARLGRDVAAAVAHRQEARTTRRADSRVDRHNNAVGQAYGEAHATELRSASVSDAVERLVPVALAKWDAGELVWVTRR